MNGFFALSDKVSKPPLSILPHCDSCGLYKHCKSPKMDVFGKGKREILIIAENPGKREDEQGRPLCGQSGQYLRNVLYKNDVNMDRDCWLYNATICHKEKDGKNVVPTDKEIDACRPNVIKTIKTLKPKTIILLGGVAVKSVLFWTWKEAVDSISRWAGWKIPDQMLNSWIAPTFHPSYVQRQAQQKDNVAQILFERHIAEAVEKKNRPWKVVPDYHKMVDVLYDENEVEKRIDKIIASGKPAAFDFETDRLKPDAKDSRIVCCSISNKEDTISYPWTGKCITATRKFLLSPILKTGSNEKFEIRWSLKEFGFIPVNMYYDQMQGSHVLDNRRKITSVKFQSYVLLGVPEWDSHLKPYLTSPNSNAPNRIHEADQHQLLLYCGIDSLVEILVSYKQCKKLGIVL